MSTEQQFFAELVKAMTDPVAIQALHGNSKSAEAAEKERACSGWLGALKLLHGVPFHYLVPDPRLLREPEPTPEPRPELEPGTDPEPTQGALRLFHIDANWVHHLIQGAQSVGRETSVEFAHDKAFAEQLLHVADVTAANLRERCLGQTAELEDSEPYKGPMSGFLLRSSLLADWPGLEVIAYARDEEEPLKLLRMEPLSNSVLLAIFQGQIARLVFQEPSEELYFGLNADGEKIPRKTDGTGAGTGNEVRAEFRAGDRRVLQVKDLAEKMAGVLDDRPKPPISSALFALQLIESGDRIEFTWGE